MKILMLPRYGKSGPSSRYRFYQYSGILKENNIDFKISPLFSDKYVDDLFSHRRKSKYEVFNGMLKRIFILLTLFKYDLVVIEYELFPYFPALFENLLRIFGKKYIADYDDAIFVRYNQSKSRLVRLLFGRKIERVIKNAGAVITGNRYLYEYASRFNSKVIIIPTVVSFMNYDAVPAPEKKQKFVLGWIGSPTSCKYLIPLSGLFMKLSKAGIQINIIGCDEGTKYNFTDAVINWIEWTKESEIEEIKKFSAGIMPLDDELWSKGKCGFKLIQYMACKLPVVASPVVINKELVEDGCNGFLASTIEEWERAVLYLTENPEKAVLMGQSGYDRFRDKYSLEAVSGSYIDLIRSFTQ